MKQTQPDLDDATKPKTQTVTGAGLMHWAARARAGEVHIYRMDCDSKRNGVYKLHLLWLDGRAMYERGEMAAMMPVRGANQIAQAQQMAWEAFK